MRLVFITSLLLLCISSCKKIIVNPLGLNPLCKDAVLLSIDGTMCGCCGGFLFQVDGQTFRSETAIEDLNDAFAFDKLSFPMNVGICFQDQKDDCGNRILKITKIVKR